MQFSAAAPAGAGGDGAALPVVTFRGLHGDFGPGAREAWGEEGVALPLVFSDPPNACTSELRGRGGRPVAGSVLLVERGDCYFSTKVQHAHAAGARAAVIFNDDKSGAGFYKVRRCPVRHPPNLGLGGCPQVPPARLPGAATDSASLGLPLTR